MVAPFGIKQLIQPWRRLLSEPELGVLLLSNLVLGLAYSFVVPFYSMWGTKHVGMTNWGFGVFMTITSIAGIIISTWLARRSDTHYTRRSILLLGCVTGFFGYLGYAYVKNVVLLTLIGSILLGISSITFAQLFAYAREAIARHRIPQSEAPLYMNIFRLLFSLVRMRRQLQAAAGRPQLQRLQFEVRESFRRQRAAIGPMIAAAPLLGLLGTVSGMEKTFASLAADAGQKSLEGLAGGISEVLVATESGLTVAIPAMLLVYLAHREMNRQVETVNRLERGLRRAEGTS